MTRLREAMCRNCASDFEFTAKGGVARPLCPECETTYKWCPSCGYAVVHQGFGPDSRVRGGLEGNCRQCKGRAAKVRYDQSHQHDPRASRAQKLKDRYGMQLGDWDEMVLAQGGRCAICDTPAKELHVDHCHQSGAVRGLLCPPCNKGLGHFGDDVGRMISAAAYLVSAAPGMEVPVKRAASV